MKIETFPGYVIWLKSMKSGQLFPSVVFSADVDYVTNGLISLTSKTKTELVVSEANDSEYRTYNSQSWERRINNELHRDDLRDVGFIRKEDDPKPVGLFESFQSYSKRVKPTKYYYRDITSEFGEAIHTREESISEYMASGGKIIFHKISI